MTKRIAIIAAAVLTTALAVVLLWEFRLVFAYVLISLMLAAALRPLVIRLAGKKIIFKILWILLYVQCLRLKYLVKQYLLKMPGLCLFGCRGRLSTIS